MEKQKTLQMIADISNANGVSGFEDDVLVQIRKYAAGLGEFEEDSLRNLYLKRTGNTGKKPVVMLDAHSDEVGFMVKAIRPNGTLEIITLGGWVASNIPAHLVWVKNSEGKYIRGITASTPPHFMTEAQRNKPLEVSDIAVDIGATSPEEVRDVFKVRIGAPVAPDVTFEYHEDSDLMIGKTFDCRLGCCSIIETMKALEGEELAIDLVGGFAAQEEVGVRGAKLTANHVKPDLAIVFEGCPADDTCVPAYQVQTAIKHGPMLRHIDKSMITNPRFQRFALDMAEEKGIPVQEAVRTGGSTNGASIHLSNEGVPCIVIGIPVRYAHTHYGISSFADFQNGVKLACEILRVMNAETIKSF